MAAVVRAQVAASGEVVRVALSAAVAIPVEKGISLNVRKVDGKSAHQCKDRDFNVAPRSTGAQRPKKLQQNWHVEGVQVQWQFHFWDVGNCEGRYLDRPYAVGG
eukprot:scaffold136500_cov35-Tisochrysis_lutea.AAC.1